MIANSKMKPRFKHDLVIWPNDIFIGYIESYDLWHDQGRDAVVLRYGNSVTEYYFVPCKDIKDDADVIMLNIENEFFLKAIKMIRQEDDDASVSPNARTA